MNLLTLTSPSSSPFIISSLHKLQPAVTDHRKQQNFRNLSTNKNAAAITQLTETVTILADQVENLEQVMHTLGNKFDEALTLARSSEDHMLKLGNRFDEALVEALTNVLNG